MKKQKFSREEIMVELKRIRARWSQEEAALLRGEYISGTILLGGPSLCLLAVLIVCAIQM